MYRLLATDLNVLVNIQYGIGFEFIVGNVEIETKIFNVSKKSKIVPANKNRINFNEDFIWKIDRKTLKHYLTTNEIIKIECFTTPNSCYGNIYRRQRIGYVIIKLKECQIIGRDWDQSVSIRNYKLQGSSKHYQLRIVLIIQEHQDFQNSTSNNKVLNYANKESNSRNEKLPLKVKKQDSNKNKNLSIYQNETDIYQNDNITDNQDISYKESLNKCEQVLCQFNIKSNQNKKPGNRGTHNQLKNIRKEVDQSLHESKEFLKTNEYNDYKLGESLENCLKNLEKILKELKKNKNFVSRKKNSSNSSTSTDNDTERPLVTIIGIQKKLNQLTGNMINMNEKNTNKHFNKFKCLQDILNLKGKLSEQCDTIARNLNDEA